MQKVSIIVADRAVYIDGRVAILPQIAFAGLAGAVRAVQWNAVTGTGHVECAAASDYPIATISAFESLLSAAQAVFDAEDAALIPTLAQVKDMGQRAAEAYRDALLADGLPIAAAPFNGRRLQLDPNSRDNVGSAGTQAKLALITGTPWPNDFKWILQDNSEVLLTAENVAAMADTAMSAFISCIFTCRAHKNAIAAMLSKAEVEAYDFTGGYPFARLA